MSEWLLLEMEQNNEMDPHKVRGKSTFHRRNISAIHLPAQAKTDRRSGRVEKMVFCDKGHVSVP